MRQRVYAGFISGQTAQKSPSTLYAMSNAAAGLGFAGGVPRGVFSFPRSPIYIESPRTAACAVRQGPPPMWRTRIPDGICAARHLWERAALPPEAAPPVHVRCFRCIVSFFVCVAFEKRLQIVSQKDGPCGTAFALGAMRPATSRPFCTSLQSRRACPQSAAPRAARAV